MSFCLFAPVRALFCSQSHVHISLSFSLTIPLPLLPKELGLLCLSALSILSILSAFSVSLLVADLLDKSTSAVNKFKKNKLLLVSRPPLFTPLTNRQLEFPFPSLYKNVLLLERHLSTSFLLYIRGLGSAKTTSYLDEAHSQNIKTTTVKELNV